ncbi:hypothetical protein ECZU23_53540 [Escherichia coli]|nr:hypothetical protein ECZU23_53540 [Escherichia coli]
MSEHALRFQLTANGLCQYGLFPYPLTCATLFSGFHAGRKISGQPGIADITVRFTDDGGRSLSPCQRYVFTPASFMASAACTGSLPAVGYQDLYVMTCGTIQQG